jgi:hypothetical protein
VNAGEHSTSGHRAAVTDEPAGAGPEDIAAGGPEFKLARVFDFSDPVTGPGFLPDHPVISDQAERDRLLEYLRGGALALMTTQHMNDVLDADTPRVVPMNFYTDGEWIWTDTIEYYLSQHGLAPDPELATHIDVMWAQGRLVPGTDEATAIRVSEYLLQGR